MLLIRITLLTLSFLVVLVPGAQGAEERRWQATVERDTWGVPHVWGATDADAAFGLGYAQAEDTWSVIEGTMPYYRGNAGKFFGRKGAESDFLVKWLGLWDDLEAGYERDLQPATREYLEAFAAGLNRFAADHPERVELDLLPFTGKDIVAAHMLRHLLFYGFDATVKEVLGGTRARPLSPAPAVSREGQPIGSNAIAVSPARSGDGSTLLVINSHQPLSGPVAWYEAHVQSDEGLNVMGGLFPGAPAVGVGFTPTTAWGATVNKPDLTDVYVLDINPEDENQYRLDGEWRTLQQQEIELEVLIWGFIPWSVDRTLYRSEHGPVLKTDHGTYAVRYAGMGELRQVEQWLAMNKATDFASWKAAVELNHIQSFNFVYAGSDQQIYFVHNSEMPVRAKGWDWQRYLPGDRSDLIWDSYLPFARLPQIHNPDSGFILSVNQSPFFISSPGSNPDPAASPVESGWQTRMTNRAVRGLELFAEQPVVSRSALNRIKHDNAYSPQYRGADFLRTVIALNVQEPELREAQAILKNWDLATDKDNRGAGLGVCVIRAEWRSESGGLPMPEPRATLEGCVEELTSMTGRLDPKWGDINRHGHGEFHVAMAGGPDTLRAAYAGEENVDHRRVTGGDGLHYLVSWDAEGKQTVSGVHQYGSHADDPDHPHYNDQTEDFANEVMHPTLFDASVRRDQIEQRYRVSSTSGRTTLE